VLGGYSVFVPKSQKRLVTEVTEEEGRRRDYGSLRDSLAPDFMCDAFDTNLASIFVNSGDGIVRNCSFLAITRVAAQPEAG
jgi:hypothetical protein